ncbi:hypothetical protein DFAR_1750006 [Desulfarculales bacterium]
MALDRADLIRSCRRLVVKVGSGVLAGPEGLDRYRVELLTAQTARLRSPERQVLLGSSGAVATGRAKMGLLDAKLSTAQKQAAAALGQAGLMQAYEAAFEAHDQKVAQVLLTANDLRDRTRYENARNTLTIWWSSLWRKRRRWHVYSTPSRRIGAPALPIGAGGDPPIGRGRQRPEKPGAS